MTGLVGQGRIYDPFTVSLHLTDLCNSACVFCGEDSHQHSRDTVQTAKLLEFLGKNSGGKWTAVNIHGGEPTIRPDFLRILEKIRELGYKKIILQTNALKMADPGFARDVNQIGVDVFTVGFHGHTAELADRITQRQNYFKRVIKGFEHIKESGSVLRTTTVVCKLNYRNIKDICVTGIKNGVDHVNISAMQPGGSAEPRLDQLMIAYEEAYPYIKEAIDYARAENKIVTLEGFPYCAVPGYEQYQINWKQQQLKVLYRDLSIADFNHFLATTMRTKADKCQCCALTDHCSGVYNNYISFYGWEQFHPYE